MRCFRNGKEVSDIHVLDRAFHYGDGCFTTARVRNGLIEMQQRHFTRLGDSCSRLALKADLKHITQTLELLAQTQESVTGTLKILISRGQGQRGYSLPDHPADVWVYYYPAQMLEFTHDSMTTGVLKQSLGLSMPALVGLKSLNRLEQVMLKTEADLHGWQEALVTDVQGAVVEGVSSNCFMRINDTWITPELRYNGVHGVMRAEILERMQQSSIVCEQRYVDMDEIRQIQSLFFCNALHPMKIAAELNQRQLEVQPCIDLFNVLQLNQIH